MVEGTDQELDIVSAEPSAEIDRIKDEIVDVRSQMGETIDEIQDRLSVSTITANIKEEVSEQIAGAVDSTKEALYGTAVRGLSSVMKSLSALKNMSGGVLPLVLIGAGAGLIVMNRGSKGYRSGTTTNGRAKNRATNQHTSPGPSTDLGIAEAASSVYHRVEDAVSSTASKVAEAASSGKEKYVNYLDQNPMAVGAVAAAIGLAVGLALPLTETETELLGETAGSIRKSIESSATEALGNIKETASEFLDNAEEQSTTASTSPRS